MSNVLAIDEIVANTVTATVNNTQSNIQQIVNGYNGLNIGNIDNVAEILTIGKSPEQYFKNKLVDANGTGANINGLVLSRSKLLELIELPENFVNFIQLLKDKLNEIDDDIELCKKQTGFNVLKFDIKNESVLPTSELKEIIEKAGKYYATTPNQITVYEKIKSIIDIMVELRQIEGATGYGQKHINLDIFLKVDPNTFELVPNHTAILEKIK